MKKIILVVEDNDDILEEIALLLQFSDYTIINSNNGKSALGLLENNKPDVIVSDLFMPGINGLELLQKVRRDKRFADIPFIMMSADPCKLKDIDTWGYKNTRLLVKPFETEELLENIISLVNACSVPEW
jgi:CheY-like chemotaxis protein